jgi:1-acyl-sn-glycerol-3-phosphate acyltransferase
MNAAGYTKSTAAPAPCISGHLHLVASRYEAARVSTRGRVASTPPQISRLMLRWFTWYSRRYLRRHFHSLRISHTGLPNENGERPLIIYANHASWWDPMVFLVLKDEFFHNYSAFAPIESAMLERYQFFRRLGFFGVQRQTASGALEFLRTAEAILQSRQNMLAITPQARFADIRERPLKFAPGLGHLATRLKHVRFVPFAAEYTFWNVHRHLIAETAFEFH